MPLNWDSPIYQTDILVGIIFIIAALITLLFPPRKINSLYGYRTRRSMQSEDRWEFAQKYSSIKILIGGIVLTLFAYLGVLINLRDGIEVIIGILAAVISIGIPIYMTEKAIKNKFKIEKDN